MRKSRHNNARPRRDDDLCHTKIQNVNVSGNVNIAKNAMRRMERLKAGLGYEGIPKPAPDSVSNQNPQNTWKTMLGWAIGIGVVLFMWCGKGEPNPRFDELRGAG